MLYAEKSAISFRMVQWALRSVDLVCPTSATGAAHVAERFGIPVPQVRAISWGVDRRLFSPASDEQRAATRRRLGLHPERPLVMNVRRFRPIWGSEVVMDAFLQLAQEVPEVSFVLLGGRGTEGYVGAARRRISVTPFADRFVFCDGDLPLGDCAELMAASDIFVSLMGMADMRSSSVLQAASAGAVPVLAEHAEYRHLERCGFRAQFVGADRPAEVADAVRRYLADDPLRRSTRIANQEYIARWEDFDAQMEELLRTIRETSARVVQ